MNLGASSLCQPPADNEDLDAASSLLVHFVRNASSLDLAEHMGEATALRLLPLTLVLLRDSSKYVRRTALEALGAWCSRYSTAAQRVCHDSASCDAVTAALENGEHEAVRLILILVQGAQDEDAEAVRLRCSSSSSAITKAVTALTACVHDLEQRRSMDTRRDAALALSHLALWTHLPVDILPALVEAMRWVDSTERSNELRLAAASALAAMLSSHPEARKACVQLIPQLVALLSLPRAADVCVSLGLLASNDDGVSSLLSCRACIPTLASLVHTNTPGDSVQPTNDASMCDRDRLAAAAARCIANMCSSPHRSVPARDALAACDALCALIRAIQRRATRLEPNRKYPRRSLSDDALDAATLALANAIVDHDTNASRAIACGALPALITALPYALPVALRALHTLVHRKSKRLAALRELRPHLLLEALRPRLTSDAYHLRLLDDILGELGDSANCLQPCPPTGDLVRPATALLLEPAMRLKGSSSDHRPITTAASPVNMTRRPATASKYMPHRRTSLW